MRTITIYGTDQCPMCVELKKNLKNKNIEFEYIDILESMSNLKEFLTFRDNSEFFDDYKTNGKLGVPLTVIEENDEYKLYVENYTGDFE